MRNVVPALTALLILSACQTSSPGITPAMLAERGAKPVSGDRLASIFMDQTVYVVFVRDYRTMKAGETWVEYYAPDGSYYYKDRADYLRGEWVIDSDKLCFIEDDKKYCTTVYEQNQTYYFVYLNSGQYQNQTVGRTTRFAKGNVESLRDPFSFK